MDRSLEGYLEYVIWECIWECDLGVYSGSYLGMYVVFGSKAGDSPGFHYWEVNTPSTY